MPNTIMLDLVDRSDEVVVGMIDRVSKLVLCIACRKRSEVVPETRGLSKACRGNRLRRRHLEVS